MTTPPAGGPVAEALAPGASDGIARGERLGDALPDVGDGEPVVPVAQPVTIDSAATMAASEAGNRTSGTFTLRIGATSAQNAGRWLEPTTGVVARDGPLLVDDGPRADEDVAWGRAATEVKASAVAGERWS